MPFLLLIIHISSMEPSFQASLWSIPPNNKIDDKLDIATRHVPNEAGRPKPPFSYNELIEMAIHGSPDGKLTSLQIYKWICDTFEFYRESGPGVYSSIRYKLSKGKVFVKKEIATDHRYKSHYWALPEGFEPPCATSYPTCLTAATNSLCK